MKYALLPAGILFGFILSRAGATTYDYYAKLFLFQDLQLLWVIATAGGIGMVGVMALKRLKAKTIIGANAISFKGKPYNRLLIPGSLLFGVGWGVAGACPGTALVMAGEGKLGALFTIAGILVGTYAFGALRSQKTQGHPATTNASS